MTKIEKREHSGGRLDFLFCCWLKFWRQAAKTFTSDEQSSPIFRGFHTFTAMESEQEVFKNYGVRFAKERKKR